jgi:DNA-binding transcriptional LysR family regulator
MTDKLGEMYCHDNPGYHWRLIKLRLIMRRDLLDGVVAFLRVAERRSFTAAAAELGVSAQAISQIIKQLERRAGVALFTRTTRDVALTEAGRLFLADAKPGAEAIASAFRSAEVLGVRPVGHLRLNVPRIALAGLIEPILSGFNAAYPEVTIEIFVEDRLANIVEDGFDAGIRLGEIVDADMVGVRLSASERMTVIGAPDYLARRGRPETPADLRDHACINFRNPSRGDLYRWEFEVDGRDIELAVGGAVIVNDSGLVVASAVMGLGLGYTVASVAAPLVEQGLLEPVLGPYCPETPGFFLYFPSRAQVLPKLRAFIDFARSRLPQSS